METDQELLDSKLGPEQPITNSNGILVLGILSILFAGIIGIILGIIAMRLFTKAKFEYDRNPGMYSLKSYKNMEAGRICAIIGMILSGLAFVILTLLSKLG